MSFQVKKHDNYTLIKTNVEKLDSLVAPALKSELVVLNGEGVKNIIIDLSETRYCDSSGLSAILVGNRLCKGLNGMLIVTGLQDSVKKLITISQLDNILKSAPTVEGSIEILSMQTAG